MALRALAAMVAATAAQLNGPTSVAVDDTGNLYIADKANNRIRKVNTAGIITTIAGDGTAGFGGDGFAATGAQLNAPRGVAIDTAGNIYIADAGNQRIRKVNSAGIISPIAGTGTGGYSGDGGPAVAAQLYGPYCVWVTSIGDMLVADVDNERIRMIATDGTITTVAGTGSAGYSGDGGLAASAQLNEPIAVVSDSTGNIFIADGWNNRVRKVATDGTISTIAGTGSAGFSGDGGTATGAQLNNPYGVATRSGSVYIADNANNRVRYVTEANGIGRQTANAEAVIIYPNPVKQSFNIYIGCAQNTIAHVSLCDISGRIVYSAEVRTNKETMLQPNVPAGTYVTAVLLDDRIISSRLIVKQ
jgi:hypothetical protein